jgi:hypothetical protein
MRNKILSTICLFFVAQNYLYSQCTLTSPNVNPSVCLGNQINQNYSTNANISGPSNGLPAGVNYTFNNGIINFQGSSGSGGTYIFQIPLSGCPGGNDTILVDTLIVNPIVLPSFTQVAAICSGATIPALPTSSTNATPITGTWSPAINNTATTTYTFTPTAGQCATTATMTVTVNQPTTPTFTQVAAICSGGTFTLPTTSNNSITGTWSPAINNTATTTYTFTPTAGQCATTVTMTVTVNQPTTPTFTQVAAICNGGSFTLPTTSNNIITGTWSPAINNTSTTTYTFTPTAGQCATTATITVTVNQPVTPTFTQLAAICNGGTFTLPTTSNNSITGTWSPAINNTATTTYTFTPTAGQCATTATMTVSVNQPVTPTFTQLAAICNGGTFTLPTTSNNSITGTWSPAINNTATTTYTFTPTAGQCATTATMTVTVNQPVTPTFTQVAAICNGGTFTLPTTSNNSITGTWSPAINNTATTTYTFTPTAGQCATTATMTVVVNPNTTPLFTQVGPYCQESTPAVLPTTSNNGITGSWSPSTISTALAGTTVYTFTPTSTAPSTCATNTSMSITINSPAIVDAGADITICYNTSTQITGNFSGATSTITWYSLGGGQFQNNTIPSTLFFPSLAENSIGTAVLILTSNDPVGPCNAATDTLIITIGEADFVTANSLDTIQICSGDSITLNGQGANYYIWSGGIQNNVPFAPLISGWYEVNGYINPQCFDNDFVYLNVLDTPLFGLPDDTLICSGTLLELVNEYSDEAVTWMWNSNYFNVDTISIFPINPDYLFYESVHNSGCSYYDSMYVHTPIIPQPNIIGDTTGCSNAYWMQYSTFNSGNQIEWEIINGNVMALNYNNIYVHFDDSLTAKIIVKENPWATNCIGTDTLNIALSDGPALEPANINILYPGSNVLYTSIDYPIMNWGYESKIDQLPIYINQHNQYCEFIPLDTTNYYYWVEVGNNEQCLTKSYLQHPTFQSNITEIDASQLLLTIFPNPTLGELKISNENLMDVNYQLIDATGRIVYYSKVKAKSIETLDISHLNNGCYFFKVQNSAKPFIERILKF